MFIRDIVNFKGVSNAFEDFLLKDTFVLFKTKDGKQFLIIHSEKRGRKVYFRCGEHIMKYTQLLDVFSEYVSNDLYIITCNSERLYPIAQNNLVLRPFIKKSGDIKIRRIDDGFEII